MANRLIFSFLCKADSKVAIFPPTSLVFCFVCFFASGTASPDKLNADVIT